MLIRGRVDRDLHNTYHRSQFGQYTGIAASACHSIVYEQPNAYGLRLAVSLVDVEYERPMHRYVRRSRFIVYCRGFLGAHAFHFH